MNRRNLILSACAVLLIAVPFMHLIGLIDPVRESVGLKTYFTCVVSLTFTLMIFLILDRKAHAQQIVSMRLDGLNEEQILNIVGNEKYRKMLLSL
jgi:Na+/melibiose symporter-like transporter